jgi:hypothetical protein
MKISLNIRIRPGLVGRHLEWERETWNGNWDLNLGTWGGGGGEEREGKRTTSTTSEEGRTDSIAGAHSSRVCRRPRCMLTHIGPHAPENCGCHRALHSCRGFWHRFGAVAREIFE